MRIKGRIISFALAAMMVFSTVPAPVYAAEDKQIETTTETEDLTEISTASPTDPETEISSDKDTSAEEFAENSETSAKIGIDFILEENDDTDIKVSSETDADIDTAVSADLKKAPAQYSITYVNGKTNPDNPSTYVKSSNKITLQSPSWKGYTFKGWFSDPSLTNRVYAIEANSTGNKTFYAKWAANKYTVEFDGNGATSGSMKHMVCTYGESYFFRYNTFYRKGYFFANWNTKPDGSGKTYPDQDSFINLRSGQDAVVTLYAQWDPAQYYVEFKPYRATSGTMTGLSCKYGTNYKLPANKYKRTGYTFTGWNTKADGSGRSLSEEANFKDLTSVDGNTIYLYPQWKKTTYKIVYNLGGGTNNSKNPSGYNITTDTITLKDASRPGYIFKGWYSDSAYKHQVTSIPKGSTGKKTLYAKWELRTYTIKYEYSGTIYGSMIPTYTIETETFTLPTPTLTGYKFCGWYKNRNYTGSPLFSLKKGTYKNLHLYAKMEPISYKVVFMGNGATGGNVAPMTCTYNTVYQFPANTFTKTRSVFRGWSTTARDGASVLGSSFKNLSIKDGSTVYIYAQWTGAIKLSRTQNYPINTKTYDKNNSINGMMNITGVTFLYTDNNNGKYNMTINVTGTKTYERTSKNTIATHYIVTKTEGGIVAEGNVFINGLSANQTFTRDINIYNLSQGEYKVSFYDFVEQ